jgi:hypothetical protein
LCSNEKKKYDITASMMSDSTTLALLSQLRNRRRLARRRVEDGTPIGAARLVMRFS